MKHAIIMSLIAMGSLSAQNLPTGTPQYMNRSLMNSSPLPTKATAPNAGDIFYRLKDGMEETQALKIIERSPDRILTGDGIRPVIDGGDRAEVWDWPQESSLVVIFKHKKIKTYFMATSEGAESDALKQKHQKPPLYSADSAGGGGNGVARVANAISGVYLTYACPRVYSNPVIWMTAADLELVQACNANGFMAFGVYIYTGGGRY